MREYTGEKLADELLSLCQLMNRPQYLPKMPTRSELPLIFEDRFSDSQPYLFRIESDYGKPSASFHSVTETKTLHFRPQFHSTDGNFRQIHGRVCSRIFLRPQAVQGYAHLLQLSRLSWNTSAVPVSASAVRLPTSVSSASRLHSHSRCSSSDAFPSASRQFPEFSSSLVPLRCTTPLFRPLPSPLFKRSSK